MAITSGCWESTDWYMVMLGLLSMSSTWSSARLGLRSLSSDWMMVKGGKEVSFRWLGNLGTEVEGGQVLGSSKDTEWRRSLTIGNLCFQLKLYEFPLMFIKWKSTVIIRFLQMWLKIFGFFTYMFGILYIFSQLRNKNKTLPQCIFMPFIIFIPLYFNLSWL